MQVGDTVFYTCEFDADTSYSPNINPAMVTKINVDGSLDLCAISLNGLYFKEKATQDLPGVRGTWHPRV